MASPAPFFDSPVIDVVHEDIAEQSPLPKPLSGPGTSRQTRRLQLRNAGFRAAAVPTRKVTPKSVSESSRWSSLQSGSDAENMSPSAGVTKSSTSERRQTSGILQEIGNGTLTRPKRSRPRVSSARFFDPQVESYDAAFTSPMSPTPPRSSIKAKSVKTRAKVNVKGRRSVSGEARLYIDHLEAELAAAQSQLSAVNSPSVTREQSSKLRTLNSEMRQLQEDLEEWETRYEQRVQEEIDRHHDIEAGLRTQVRKLEEDAEEAKYRVAELEAQLAAAGQTFEATETANVNLEKRLEIMSELLATSPTKLDLHAEAPWARKRHQRPKSMLPRFPTASSLMQSPEKTHESHYSSPILGLHQSAVDHPGLGELSINTSFSQSDIASDVESVFSDTPATGDSMTSAEPTDGMPNFNPWTLQAVQSARSRPARRMRRFGAGSVGPKPLILPSTSNCEQIPVSAPPLERSETTPAFAFPFPVVGELQEEDDSQSSLMARRRASTTADETTIANLAVSSFLKLPQHEEDGDQSLLSVICPLSGESQATTKDFSSLGSITGRNLLEELCAARTNETAQSSELVVEDSTATHQVNNSPPTGGDVLKNCDETGSTSGREETRSQHMAANVVCLTNHNLSMWDRLSLMFGDIWRSPVSAARYLIQTAQARMHIPKPLHDVQWWLVGVLLGPMARRKVLHSTTYRVDGDQQALLEAASPSARESALVYGTMYQTPPTSPRRTNITSDMLQKRLSSDRVCSKHYSRHSPWVWLRFSITLAFAVGVAFKDGPASLLRTVPCGCEKRKEDDANLC